RIWQAASGGVTLRRGNETLGRWPGRLPAGSIAVTRSSDRTTTVWIASGEGLIEFPIPPLDLPAPEISLRER
ncbi:MAG: hypothetical protein O7H39_15470, partial [Gammaproteobacteria bacterium]|nr:hypothetical protein [Gammaproteobacteria bacterium]